MRGTLVLLIFSLGALAFGAASPCRDQAEVVVQLTAHRLWLCAPAGEQSQSFRVAIGRGGIHKQREGDGKSPVGIYPLGAPRPSQKFGTFIPVGYPTDEERKTGFTGSDIGIHGPPRGLFLFGMFSTWVDWTAGCVAVGSQSQIQTIASWLRQHRVAQVSMRAE